MTTVVAQSSASSSILRGQNPTSISNSFSDDGLNRNIHPHPGIANPHFTLPPHSLASVALEPSDVNPSETDSEEEEEEDRFRKWRRKRGKVRQQEEEGDNWSALALFLTALRKSLVRCYNDKGQTECSTSGSSSFSSSCSSPTSSSSSSSWNKMEIGVPTNVRHVAHVTFDRFNGFLGLPVEFEPEVSRRAPSASAKVFGVSTNSMQLSFDSRGNSVPTILLMMQHRLYALGGLEAEGIFRINAGNDQEEYVRDQLNQGVVPVDTDVHCLAGLIKAWFRELPSGLLDSLSPEHLMMSQTEEECAELARHLPPTEASLLDWAVNLMADIVQHENLNKMNARNVAVVFAPNMTHVMDPLTALMHAVQVMNFLKNLISRTLREREDSILDAPARSSRDRFDENGPQTPLQTIFEETSEGSDEENYNNNNNNNNNNNKSCSPIIHHHGQDDHSDSALKGEKDPTTFLNSIENNSILQSDFDQSASVVKYSDGPTAGGGGGGEPSTTSTTARASSNSGSGSCEGANKPSDNKKTSNGLSVKWALDKAQRKGSSGKMKHQPVPTGKASKATNVVNRVNSRAERVEAWR